MLAGEWLHRAGPSLGHFFVGLIKAGSVGVAPASESFGKALHNALVVGGLRFASGV